jgi:cellulose synthase/poly-beta-1,6-N-acetylglucosamine synthase-like glycosyltransferase
LSILTRLQCHSFAERLILPLAGAAWSFMFVVAQTNNDKLTNTAAANGQFFLIRRAAYEAVGGHAAVRDQITEDVELMRRLKRAEYRTRLCFGDHLAATRMHSTVQQMVHGWGRIFSGTARRQVWPMLGGILFILIAGFSVWPALIYGIFHSNVWLSAAITHWFLMTMYAALVYTQAGQPKRNAIFFPLGQAALIVLFGYGIRMSRTGRVFWRDTHYASWTPAARGGDAAGDTVAIADRLPRDPAATATDARSHIGVPIPPE